jgi:hypothetical protein
MRNRHVEKATHIKDLQRLEEIVFDHLAEGELGGLELDYKRPFGNSYVQGDILDLLGKTREDGDDWSKEQELYASQLYSEVLRGLRKKYGTGGTHTPDSRSRILTCVYCGHEYPQGTGAWNDEILTKHIKICPKHPMREAEAKIKQLEERLKDAGLDDGETDDIS